MFGEEQCGILYTDKRDDVSLKPDCTSLQAFTCEGPADGTVANYVPDTGKLRLSIPPRELMKR